MINQNMAEQYATMLLRINPEQEFDVTFPGEEKSIDNLVTAFQRRGCHVEHDQMALHVVRAPTRVH